MSECCIAIDLKTHKLSMKNLKSCDFPRKRDLGEYFYKKVNVAAYYLLKYADIPAEILK